MLGHDAGEVAQLLGVALKAGITKEDFDRTMAIDPTAMKEQVTMYAPSYRIRKANAFFFTHRSPHWRFGKDQA